MGGSFYVVSLGGGGSMHLFPLMSSFPSSFPRILFSFNEMILLPFQKNEERIAFKNKSKFHGDWEVLGMVFQVCLGLEAP